MSSLWAAEGTRLANLGSEKSFFINMRNHPVPLKQAFVLKQMLEHKQDGQIQIKAGQR